MAAKLHLELTPSQAELVFEAVKARIDALERQYNNPSLTFSQKDFINRKLHALDNISDLLEEILP